MIQQQTLKIQGRDLPFAPGETVLEVARRNGIEIPTLCHDPRLEPAGACRTCLVEIDGWRRLAPACATKASAGMVVASENERIDRHRKTLLALYVTDHDAETKPGQAPNELLAMVQQYAAPENWGVLENKREARAHDVNPYIHFDPTMCIACARCTRYCDEVEQVTAITRWPRFGDDHLDGGPPGAAGHDLRDVRRLRRHLPDGRDAREAAVRA